MDEFGFGHGDIMRMPYRTFLAYQRYARTRAISKRNQQRTPR